MQAVEENEKYLFWEEQIEKWQASGGRIEALLIALGAELSEGRGSSVRISLNGVRAVFIDHILKKKRAG